KRYFRSDGFYNELNQIPGTTPVAGHFWPGPEAFTFVALKPSDAKADHRHAVNVRIIASESLAEDFSATIDGAGADRHFWRHPDTIAIIQDRLARAGVNYLPQPG